jgi:Integrase core domain
MKAIMERWVASVRRELLDRILIIDAAHLRKVAAKYESHFNGHRPHRALDQASPLRALPDPIEADVKVIRREGSAASSTNTPRSHEATEFRAPTGMASGQARAGYGTISSRQRVVGGFDRRRKCGGAHQVPVDGSRRAAALCQRPHDQ